MQQSELRFPYKNSCLGPTFTTHTHTLTCIHIYKQMPYLFMCVFSCWQGADCGAGLRRRNLSCVVHWGDKDDYHPQPAKTELCGDIVRQHLQQEMEQPCFVPCPGKTAFSLIWFTSLLFKYIDLLFGCCHIASFFEYCKTTPH